MLKKTFVQMFLQIYKKFVQMLIATVCQELHEDIRILN